MIHKLNNKLAHKECRRSNWLFWDWFVLLITCTLCELAYYLVYVSLFYFTYSLIYICRCGFVYLCQYKNIFFEYLTAKAYALQGIEAAEDSSATNLGCSNLREKQKEAIVSFVSGKDVLVHLPTGNESLFATLCCHGYRAYFTFLWHNAINNVLSDPLPWVGCGVRNYIIMVCKRGPCWIVSCCATSCHVSVNTV